MDFTEVTFRRRFSVNPCKSLRILLGRMDCSKNWIRDGRGDPYPVTFAEGEGNLTESLPNGRYEVGNDTGKSLKKARLLGGHMPCTTYEVQFDRCLPEGDSRVGILLSCTAGEFPVTQIAAVGNKDGKICVELETRCGDLCKEKKVVPTGALFEDGISFAVSIHGGGLFNFYRIGKEHPEFLFSTEIPDLKDLNVYDVFMRTSISLYTELMPEDVFSGGAQWYLDAGGSQADIKSIRYEDGSPLYENGKLFLTVSVREERGSYQAVLSWKPGTAEFALEGGYFFDYGDDRWCGDIASSVVYDRNTKLFYVWACAFSQGHILCHAVSRADLRYGIHVLDAVLMPRETGPDGSFLSAPDRMYTVSDDSSFLAKSGDEDPDLVFDSDLGKWRLILCRSVKEGEKNRYRYFSFISDNPFEGFVFDGKTTVGSETGGSVVYAEGERYLICGSDFDLRSRYYVHPIRNPEFAKPLKFDYDDGGFRGWGTVLSVPCGNRTKYYLVTFDRHNCYPGNNWSYGNLYVFEADRMTYGLCP